VVPTALAILIVMVLTALAIFIVVVPTALAIFKVVVPTVLLLASLLTAARPIALIHFFCVSVKQVFLDKGFCFLGLS
jgi:hypothetical protein